MSMRDSQNTNLAGCVAVNDAIGKVTNQKTPEVIMKKSKSLWRLLYRDQPGIDCPQKPSAQTRCALVVKNCGFVDFFERKSMKR